ncbi:hypothetical protein CISIN_1g0074091mg, partial [Citrus sinensis]
MNLEI